MENRFENKRLFIQLSLVSIILVMLILISIVVMFIHDLGVLLPIIVGIGGLIVLFLISLGIGVFAIVLTVWKKKPYPVFEKFIPMALSVLFPIAIAIGRLFGIDKNRVKLSFIEVHNQLIQTKSIKIEPEDILLLLPHCLQVSECKYKITMDVDNCHRCGKCLISNLLELRDDLGFHMHVATGGTLARKTIEKVRPKAIVAVACERDLSSGIQDTAAAFPVLGVLNEYQEGPCINTTADINKIEDAICFFLKK